MLFEALGYVTMQLKIRAEDQDSVIKIKKLLIEGLRCCWCQAGVD